MSLQDDIFDVQDALDGKPEREAFDRIMESHNRLERFSEAIIPQLKAMEAGTFYCEDDEGRLRRWFPPEPLDILKPRASTDDTPRHSDAP